MEEENKRIYYVNYKDGGDYGCAEEVEVYESEMNPSTHRSYSGEKIAVIKVQQDLLDDYNFMSRLIEVYEITPEVAIHDDDEDDGQWRIKDGPVLDQDSQDALNDAMGSYTNSSGLTLEQAMERASQRKNK